MSHIDIKKAPSLAAVVPFYAVAAIAFLILSVLMFFSADAFLGHYFQPRLLAIVHTAALGWGTMIIFGSLYQLIPVIFEQQLYSAKIAILSFILLLAGSCLLVHSFWNFAIGPIMQTGAVTVLAAVLLFALNVFLTASGSAAHSLQKDFITMSGVWLVVTAVLGNLLVFNFSYPIFHASHLQVLSVHAHAGLAGWFLMLIIGAGTKLIPMFLLSKSSRSWLLSFAFYAINISLTAFLVDGLIWGLGWRVWLYAGGIVAGIAAFLLYVYELYKKRPRKKMDFPMKQSLMAMPMLGMALGFLPFVLLKPQLLQLAMSYGILLFMGWITSLILGMTFKTLPFIIWNDRYKDMAGKAKIPMPKQLFSEALVKWQLYLYLASMLILLIGTWSGYAIVVRLAAAFLIATALIYCFNCFKVIFHRKTTVK